MRLFKNSRREDDLREFALLADTSRSELAQIRQLLIRLTVPAGTVLTHQGAFGNEFMIVVDGVAEVSQDGAVIATIGRGELVGEMALLQDGRGQRNATVTAVTEMTVYVGTPAEFRQILDVAPSVAEKVRRTAASRALQAA
jgi:CRP/FNR family transcriptional regulator, cyclic AMP receptor protein